MSDDRSVIPHGPYCYEINGIDVASNKVNEKLCPYWSLDPEKPAGFNGHCRFLNFGDWESDCPTSLYDRRKECGVNEKEGEFVFFNHVEAKR